VRPGCLREPVVPKNIVLLSDGTGNSSAKLMKTNVWRLYEAVELSTGDQIALYDNGVGTSSFRPLAILGGALGWGLKRNVRTLYTFACNNFRTGAEADDRLFAFGFSRGAFTIRVLVGLIESQGLITGVKGRELNRLAKWAYREYRREFNTGTWLVRRLRDVRDWVLQRIERGPAYASAGRVRPRITFVGLWDTVDAYGLPVDEMTRGWDQWVWPLSLTRHTHPTIVDKLCHAIALDDERHTFHPVLLDESSEELVAHTDQERLTQVWFAGVHSNVGGGYPDDSLAYVPLRWMADEACKKGLHLHPHLTAEWKARCDPNGPAYDSRAGLGAYYRYNPRSIKKLTNDRFAEVTVPRPKIHESVFRRIVTERDGYAPIVLPEHYVAVGEGGAILPAPEHSTQAASRCADQERVWNLVWWRRIAYFLTVFLTLFLVARPFVIDANAGGVLSLPSNGLGAAIGLLSTFLPDMAQPWIEFYEQRPAQLVVLAVLIAALLVLSSRLQRAIVDRMRALWDAVAAKPGAEVTPSGPPTDRVYRLRSSPRYRAAFDVMTQKVFPFVFGMACLAALLVLATGTANRATFAAFGAAGNTCIDDPRPRTWDGTPTTVTLPSKELCQQTGLVLNQGQRYRVEIELPPGQWKDKTLEVKTPAGFSSGADPRFLLFLPFRRVLTTRWFVPMVRIGDDVAEYHPLNQLEVVPDEPRADGPSRSDSRRINGNAAKRIRGFAEFAPARTGQMFLFVNDAILPGPWLKTFYDNNQGTATVTVSAIEPDPVALARR
jgi:uncharacterized protein (DUF2235 family)